MTKPKILIVDDESDLLEILRDGLEPAGYIVQTVTDGERALKMIQCEPPDVVVLDFKLPGIDGLEVLKRIKRNTPQPLVIMITAYDRELNILEVKREGALILLKKPLDPNLVREWIEKGLEKQGVG